MAFTATSGKSGTTVFGRSGVLAEALRQPLTNYYLILVSASLLSVMGVMMVQSASSVYAQVQTGDPYFFIKRQVVFLVAGLVTVIVLIRLPVRMIQRTASTNRRLSFAVTPRSPILPGKRCSIRTHWSSRNIVRSILSLPKSQDMTIFQQL